jgi:phosphoglycolate phosphatase-like HAD superfamily hydrolase
MPLHLFIDFDDTLSDFSGHTTLYAARLSENLAREHGGEPSEWVSVLKPAILASIARYAATFKSNPLAGICAWIPVERARIATEVFQSVGRDLPADIAPAELTLSIQTAALQACKGGAFYPGAVETLRMIHQSGVRLHMASSHESRYLAAVLRGAGIDELFDNFFGADLIDCAKEGTEYYCRMFEACGIRPEQAVVLDDGVDCMRWAQHTGAHVIQVRLRKDPVPREFETVLTDWRDLPGMISS